MKKIYILFAIFTLLMGVSFVFMQNKTVCAESPQDIVILAYDKNDHLFESNIFANNSFVLDYSAMEDDFVVTFKSNAVSGAAQWYKNNEAIPFKNEYLFTLYKNTNDASQLILVGDSKYSFSLTDESGTNSIDISFRVTDTTDSRALLFTTNFPTTDITADSPKVTLSALLPTTKPHSTYFYLKTPNSNEFIKISKEPSDTCEFRPSEIINSSSGFGTYSFMAISTENISNSKVKTHYSKVINYTASVGVIDMEQISINQTVVKNTKARVEAFLFSLSGANNINTNLVYWYVGNTLMGTGADFIYESPSTEPYRITAKYAISSDNLQELDSVRVEPQTTGTGLLLLYVGIGVAFVSILFTITLVITNKRRDNAW